MGRRHQHRGDAARGRARALRGLRQGRLHRPGRAAPSAARRRAEAPGDPRGRRARRRLLGERGRLGGRPRRGDHDLGRLRALARARAWPWPTSTRRSAHPGHPTGRRDPGRPPRRRWSSPSPRSTRRTSARAPDPRWRLLRNRRRPWLVFSFVYLLLFFTDYFLELLRVDWRLTPRPVSSWLRPNLSFHSPTNLSTTYPFPPPDFPRSPSSLISFTSRSFRVPLSLSLRPRAFGYSPNIYSIPISYNSPPTSFGAYDPSAARRARIFCPWPDPYRARPASPSLRNTLQSAFMIARVSLPALHELRIHYRASSHLLPLPASFPTYPTLSLTIYIGYRRDTSIPRNIRRRCSFRCPGSFRARRPSKLDGRIDAFQVKRSA